MSLIPGHRVGPYEIIAPLGAGGMGEVYRARDTKLNRDVAIKILPELFASDADRVSRFTREAQTLATLNHPHIAQIFGLEEIRDGEGPGFSRGIVMELVEGEDLAQRIARGPVPLDEALPIARQIAEALGAAHEKGIVHRDLKPANVKLTPDGTVKVLDFGLARHTASSAAPPSQATHPTITRLRQGFGEAGSPTQVGVILGTAAYMAPEQAKGKVVDKRADIWAFGCVLYEMLCGRRAFDGEDVSETLAAVLRSDPDWRALPSDVPRAMMTLLVRCLDRDPQRRVADMAAVRFVLDDYAGLADNTAGEPAAAATDLQQRVAEAVSRAQRDLLVRRVVPIAAGLAVMAAIGGFVGWRTLLQRERPPIVAKFAIDPLAGQLLSLARPSIAISPDGSQIAYVANGQLHLRGLADFEPRPIPATDLGQNVTAPAFSPDGEWIAFHSTTARGLKKVSVRGGPALRVCDVGSPLGMSWHPTGILVALGDDGIARCNPAGGSPQTLVQVEAGEIAVGAALLDDNETLLFSIARRADGSARWDKAAVVSHSLRTGQRKTIVTDGTDPRVTPTGHLLYTRAGVLFAAPFDAATQTATGEAIPVIDGVRRSGGPTQLSIASNGTIVYVAGPTGGVNSARALATADRTGTVTPLAGVPEGQYTHVRASPDGRALAIGTDERASHDGRVLAIGTDGSQAIVWILRLDQRGAMQRLTLEGNNRFPVWSPDGTLVAFQSDRGNQSGIYRQRADGAGRAERLTTAAAGELHIPQSWSPDGRHLAYAVRSQDAYSLVILSLADKRSEPYADVRSFEPIDAVFSPDGKWIAYARAPGGDITAADRGVYVGPFPATSTVFQVPRQIIDFAPVWSAAGRDLIFVASASSGQMVAVPVEAGAAVTFGAPLRFPAAVTGDRLSGEPRAFDILPDGRFVGIASAAADQNRDTLMQIRVITNWFAELKARGKPAGLH